MTRTGWVLFAAMSVIWGVPYFFIRVAVEDLEPPVVVFGRTSIAAVVLLVLAARSGAIRPALKHWKPVLAFGIIEMAIPWILLTSAEQHIPSGLTALLVSCVPMVGAIAAYALGDRTALRVVRVVGIIVGLGGVTLLVGRDLSGDESPPVWSIVALLIVTVCYATAPFIVSRRLVGVPSLGVIALSLSAVAVIYAPIAAFTWPSSPPPADAVFAACDNSHDLFVLVEDGKIVRANSAFRNFLGIRTKALAGRQINIRAITTSEIKFSLLIDAAYTELAVRTLHSLYGLDR